MAIPKLSTAAVIALAAAGIFLTLVTAGIIATQTITSDGTLTRVNVGVYSDRQCNQNCTSISWGAVYSGHSTSRIIYVKNTGTLPVTLSMTARSWAPTNAGDYLTLTWDQQGTVLQGDESVSANLTLSAASDASDFTNFSFDIVITGSE
jgi:hypothetical protein